MKRARSKRTESCPYVTRGGLKLDFALLYFNVSVKGFVTADLGCHRGGFTDCLLQHDALRVHVIDTAYGILDWKLRKDPRVVVHERTNLLHWTSRESLDLVVVDAGWTPQRLSIPAALRSLKPKGKILSLVKPQYEVDKSVLVGGVVSGALLEKAMQEVRTILPGGISMLGEARSPIAGSGGNVEFWLYLESCDS